MRTRMIHVIGFKRGSLRAHLDMGLRITFIPPGFPMGGNLVGEVKVVRRPLQQQARRIAIPHVSPGESSN
jgi:hypothetical protein